jgi:hypothetical protein
MENPELEDQTQRGGLGVAGRAPQWTRTASRMDSTWTDEVVRVFFRPKPDRRKAVSQGYSGRERRLRT